MRDSGICECSGAQTDSKLRSSSARASLAYSLLLVPAQAQFSQQAKLVATDALNPASQGFSVALSGNGNTAIVGGSSDDDVSAAWVYTRERRAWSQQVKLVGTGGVPGTRQGLSVPLSDDGNTAIVGGPDDNIGTGAAWVYTRSGGVWSQQAKLVGTSASPFQEQGFSVSLSNDGNTAIVGGPNENNSVAGAAWVYTRSRGVWSQREILVDRAPSAAHCKALLSRCPVTGIPLSSAGLVTTMRPAQRGCMPNMSLPGRPEKITVTGGVSQTSPESLAGSMPRPQRWGIPAWRRCKKPS